VKVPDVNVMLAAHRDDHIHHTAARSWLDALTHRGERLGVPDMVWGSFVRLTTNRRIFSTPAPLAEAFGFVQAVRALPGHVSVAAGHRHLEIFERVCLESGAIGDLVPDAQLAALAIELGAELISFDRDFARVPGLRWTRLE
jgi:toxin-antitoxin system PIN domain toxin